jgi:lipopolysaccharide export system permease protein
MLIGLALGVVVMAASFYSTPLAVRQIEKVKAQSAHRTEPHQVAPGVFTESAGTGKILYAEKVHRNGDLEGIFISSLEAGNQGVLVAKSGRPFTDSKTGDKFVALREGTLYEGEPGAANYRILEFSVYNLRLEPRMIDEPLVPMAGQPNLALLGQRGNPEANAELHWRLGKTVVLFVLALFAMVFAYTDARRGRMSNFFVAIVVFFVYSNLLGIGETMLQNRRVPQALGLWWVHGGMVLVAVYLLRRRLRNRPLFALPARLVRA